MNSKLTLIVSVALAVAPLSAGNLKPGTPFTDNMVLQRNAEVPVWGTADPGATISLTPSWTDSIFTCTASNDGHWRLTVPTGFDRNTHTLKISDGTSSLTLGNILLGEVWLLGGQSNMSMPLEGYTHQPVEDATHEILHSAKRTIRFANVPPLAAYRTLDFADGVKWEAASPATTGKCSAVGWFFASLLNEVLDVPVGILNVSFSGSNLESWLSPDACKEIGGLNVPPVSDETSPWIGNVATLLYNGMMHPVEGFGIRGMLFYQGESNIFDVPAYAPMLKAAVADWRRKWGNEFPFYITQIAPYDYSEWNFFTPQWPEISAYMREAQLKCSHEIPNSALAVTLDSGTDYVIHPPMKRAPGERLAHIALARDYGIEGFEAFSPEYESMEVKDGKAILHFSNLHNGLTSYGKPLTLFEISGDNKVFVKADAHIDESNGTIVVSSRLVSDPKAVRYAFRNYVQAELFGTGGHPVSSFRTDSWE